MKINKIILLLFTTILYVSCTGNGENVKMESINGAWTNKKVLEIPFVVQEQESKNIIFVIRNNNSYPYSNLRLFVELKDDEKKVIDKDTLNLLLAKPNGEWIGSGFGDTKEVRFQYKINYKFPKIGKYHASISHAMRKDSLSGIEDVGIIIEPNKP